MKVNRKMPNSNGVAANQTATWDLPIGLCYHNLQLEYSGITLAQMLDIRIIANGETLMNGTGAERDTINQFKGRAAAAGILVLPFDRYGLKSQTGNEATALQTGTADEKTGVAISSLKLEIDIGAAASPAIKVTASQSSNDPKIKGPGLVARSLRFTRTLGSGGVNEISDLPKYTQGPKYQWLDTVYFKTANTSAVSIVRDNYTIFERSAALNNRSQLDGVRTPQSGWFVVDPTEAGDDAESYPLKDDAGAAYQDFRYNLTLSAQETVTVFMDYLGAL